MNVFGKVRDFFGRHRGKLMIGGVVITSTLLLTKYAQQKLKDWQDRETQEFIERTRKQQHFESTERTCNQTISNLSNAFAKTINSVIDTQRIIDELKSSPENVNQIELWNRLRLLVLSRITCLMYISVMLVVTLRIQLSIIGGYLYKNSTSLSTDVQEHYLSICNNLMESGLQRLANLIEIKFASILDNIQLSKMMRLRDFDNLFWSIQTLITTSDENPVEKFKEYILTNNIPGDDVLLNELIRDTCDLLDSDEVKSLTTHCLNRGFALVSDELMHFYQTSADKSKEVAQGVNSNTFVHPGDVFFPFVKVLSALNAMTSTGALAHNLMTQLIINPRLKTLGANVYESFSS